MSQILISCPQTELKILMSSKGLRDFYTALKMLKVINILILAWKWVEDLNIDQRLVKDLTTGLRWTWRFAYRPELKWKFEYWPESEWSTILKARCNIWILSWRCVEDLNTVLNFWMCVEDLNTVLKVCGRFEYCPEGVWRIWILLWKWARDLNTALVSQKFEYFPKLAEGELKIWILPWRWVRD